MDQDNIEIVRGRIERLPDSHRLKHNVVAVRECDVWGALVGLSHFGRADLEDIHEICTDWGVYNEPIDGAIITLGVDLDGEIPLGADQQRE